MGGLRAEMGWRWAVGFIGRIVRGQNARRIQANHLGLRRGTLSYESLLCEEHASLRILDHEGAAALRVGRDG